MEAAHPFLEPAMIGIHIVDVEVGRVRARLSWRWQDVMGNASLLGEGDDGPAAVAAELVGGCDNAAQCSCDGRPVELGQDGVNGGAGAVSRNDHRDLFGGQAALCCLAAPLACLARKIRSFPLE